MPTTIKRYAFDVTGELAANKITGEEHVLTGRNSQDFQIIVPRLAPYFIDSLVLSFRNPDGSLRVLQRGKDWVYSHYFWEASHSLAKPVYGSITFTNRNLTGIVVIDYQTLGGDWTIDMNKITELLGDRIHNPPVTTWEQVVQYPVKFPVIVHDFNVVDIHGPGHVIDALKALEETIRKLPERSGGGNGGGNTPPSINATKKQLGLDKIRNLTTLPLNVNNSESDEYYLTPASLNNLLTYQHFKNLAANRDFLDPLIQSLSFYTKQQMDQKLASKLGVNDKAADSDKLGGRTTQQLAAFILQGKAADTAKINGKTPEQFIVDVVKSVNTGIDEKINNALSGISGGSAAQTIQNLPANQNSYTLDLARYTYFKVSIDKVPQLTFINAPAGRAIEITIDVTTSMPAKSSLIGYETHIFNFTQAFHYLADLSASKPGRKLVKVTTSDGGSTYFIQVLATTAKFNGA